MKTVETLFIGAILFTLTFTSCLSIETIEEAGIQYSTEASEMPTDIEWVTIGLAKELINARSKVVVVSGGSNPIDLADWEDFNPRFPWVKNINRVLLFDSTYFYRSPNVPIDCSECKTEIEYRNYSWLELAQIGGVAFVPEETNVQNPDEGHIVIKTIQKCQILKYTAGSTIYELTDNQGNYYVMHATENGQPNLDVVLPEGWRIESREISEDLILTPFGGGDDCYYNILGDHAGQGYHQYIYADDVYPSE